MTDRTHKPNATDMQEETQTLLQELADDYGLVLEPRDPLLVLHRMNRHVIDVFCAQVEAMIGRTGGDLRSGLRDVFGRLRQQTVADLTRVTESFGEQLAETLDGEALGVEIRKTVCEAIERQIAVDLLAQISELRGAIFSDVLAIRRSQRATHRLQAVCIGGVLLVAAVLGLR